MTVLLVKAAKLLQNAARAKMPFALFGIECELHDLYMIWAPPIGGGTQDTDFNKGFTKGMFKIFIFFLENFGAKKLSFLLPK